MTIQIKTDQELIRRLEEAARKSVSIKELYEQRMSFILGNLPKDSTVTREQIERVLNRLDGKVANG